MLIMNVRSYTFPVAYRAAQIFKKVNPQGMVLTGGMHATVALDEMEAIPEFDRICQGPGENIIVDLVKDPHVVSARDSGRRRQVDGRVADDRSDVVAASRPARNWRRNSTGRWNRNAAGGRRRWSRS